MITLLNFTLEDYVNFDEWINNKYELIQFGGEIFSYPINELQVIDYLNDKNRFPFKIMLDNKPIGHAEIAIEHVDSIKIAKLCRILVGDENLRGQGIGKTVINKLLANAFNEMSVDVVYLNVYDWNIGAIKCYEKASMTIVPNVFETTRINSKVWKAIRMSITRAEFYEKLTNE